MVSVLVAAVVLVGCGDKSTSSGNNNPQWDIEADGIPKFVTTDYVDLASINGISRFRSAYGHDYSHDDYLEHCRSMKHYFAPPSDVMGHHYPSWTTIPISSPISGTVSRVFDEWAGTQVWIRSQEYPAFVFRIFHVNLSPRPQEGNSVAAGQLLGHHASDETMSDIAVCVATPQGSRLISYFEVMTDSLFQSYQARGVNTRDQLIISRAERDADSLTCNGETFTGSGNLENWVWLD
jgi:hypothetical protein